MEKVMCIKLKEYIYKIRGINISKAALELNMNKETLRLWVEKGMQPRRGGIEKICAWSKGYIQPNDFYNLPESGKTG